MKAPECNACGLFAACMAAMKASYYHRRFYDFAHPACNALWTDYEPGQTARAVLAYLRAHPGASAKSIAVGLGTGYYAVRSQLTRLRDYGYVEMSGPHWATKWTVVGRAEREAA